MSKEDATKAFEGWDNCEEIEELDPLEDIWLTLSHFFHQNICNNHLLWMDNALKKENLSINQNMFFTSSICLLEGLWRPGIQ